VSLKLEIRWRLLREESVCISMTSGAGMTRIQQLRDSLKQDPLVVDCRFGPNTEKATLMFQRCVFPDSPKKWDGKMGRKPGQNWMSCGLEVSAQGTHRFERR
jgi:hypothetical protein